MTLFLTVADVAARHGVTVQCVNGWCRRGVITPCTRVGRTWLIGPNYLPPLSIIRRMAIQMPRRKPGRPKGTTGTYYPSGVKRRRNKSGK